MLVDICANDYLPVPFAEEEFLARVRAKLRRVRWEKSDDLFVIADLRLDARFREVYYRDRPIELTAKGFNLIEVPDDSSPTGDDTAANCG